MIDIVRTGGHVDRSLVDATERIGAAEEAIAGLPDLPARSILTDMGEFLLRQVTAARSA